MITDPPPNHEGTRNMAQASEALHPDRGMQETARSKRPRPLPADRSEPTEQSIRSGADPNSSGNPNANAGTKSTGYHTTTESTEEDQVNPKVHRRKKPRYSPAACTQDCGTPEGPDDRITTTAEDSREREASLTPSVIACESDSEEEIDSNAVHSRKNVRKRATQRYVLAEVERALSSATPLAEEDTLGKSREEAINELLRLDETERDNRRKVSTVLERMCKERKRYDEKKRLQRKKEDQRDLEYWEFKFAASMKVYETKCKIPLKEKFDQCLARYLQLRTEST